MSTSRFSKDQHVWGIRGGPAAVLILGVLAVLVSAGVWLAHRSHNSTHASAGTATMFAPALTAGVARQVASADPAAQRLMVGWWKAHGATADDSAFAQWVTRVFPSPPGTVERLREAQALAPLAATRTSQGLIDAQWLDDHGHDDVWKTLAQGLPSRGQSDLDDLLDFSTQLGSDLKNQFGAASPYVIDPALRTDQQTTASSGDCICSYPSSHAANGAAARLYLSHFQTDAQLLQRWEAEIDYSRLYVAGHVPSDIRAGAVLGDMIGEYFLVTRGYEPVPSAS